MIGFTAALGEPEELTMEKYSTVTYDVIVNSPSKGIYHILANVDNGIAIDLNKDNVHVFVGDYRSGGDAFNGGIKEFIYKHKNLPHTGNCDRGLGRAVLEKAVEIVSTSSAANANAPLVLTDTHGASLHISMCDTRNTLLFAETLSGIAPVSFILSPQNRLVLIEHLKAFVK